MPSSSSSNSNKVSSRNSLYSNFDFANASFELVVDFYYKNLVIEEFFFEIC